MKTKYAHVKPISIPLSVPYGLGPISPRYMALKHLYPYPIGINWRRFHQDVHTDHLRRDILVVRGTPFEEIDELGTTRVVRMISEVWVA